LQGVDGGLLRADPADLTDGGFRFETRELGDAAAGFRGRRAFCNFVEANAIEGKTDARESYEPSE
jgi:hypothetical protein